MKKFMFLFTVILFLGVKTGNAQETKTGPDAGPLVAKEWWMSAVFIAIATGVSVHIISFKTLK